ncbi:MAG: hypothetical protein ACREH9_10610 [Pseudomonadota bacterium]
MKTSDPKRHSMRSSSARGLACAGLIAALAVLLTVAMLPRTQGFAGAAQSQTMVQVHHHRAKRHERIGALGPMGPQAADAGPSASLKNLSILVLAGRGVSRDSFPRAPPART